MTDREVMQQTLEALLDDGLLKKQQAINVLRARLAEPEPEPVAWGLFAKVEDGEFNLQHPVRFTEADAEADQSMYERGTQIRIQPLYTAPPTRRPLTDEEIDALATDEDGLPNSHLELARAIEAAHGIKEER